MKDIAYATKSAAQKLDVYTPTGTGPFPVVLWIHAGAWQSGDKKLPITAHQLLLLASGYAVVSVNYRLSAEAKFPAQIHDVKAAVRWVRANAALYKFDPNRVGVWGHSAGAHLAALLGTSRGVAGLTDVSLGNPTQSEAVKAVVAQATPVYLLTMDQQLAIDGCPKYGGVGFNAASSPASRLLGAALPTIQSKVVLASPRAHVNAGDSKFLLQHGTGDCTIPWQQGDFLHTRLRAVLGTSASTLDLFPGGKHDDINFRSSANVARIVTFLRSAL
ncbi:MAG: alpha/beta hydrolase [Cytophagaceae bacterium]|nr:alpha/beta hydrolase [Gemmatimonadaceae bacterium]